MILQIQATDCFVDFRKMKMTYYPTRCNFRKWKLNGDW